MIMVAGAVILVAIAAFLGGEGRGLVATGSITVIVRAPTSTFQQWGGDRQGALG
jgi:hypothetical protein